MDNIIRQNKKGKQQKNYFTKKTEEMIMLYNITDDFDEKSKIYERYIHYPLYKLTENLIHTFKFYKTDVENLEDLQHEVMVFLLDKMHLYHQSKNVDDKIKKITKDFGEEIQESFLEYVNNSPTITQSQINNFICKLGVSIECRELLEKIKVPKAYSYFGTIAKNWLIVYARNNYKKQIEDISINNTDQMYLDNNEELVLNEEIEENIESDEHLLIEGSIDNLSQFIDEWVVYCTENIYKIFPRKNDAQIADAILQMFRSRENISVFKKSDLYVQIKQIVDVKTPKITRIANKLKSIFDKKYSYYLSYGHFPN